ncbi:MAG: hypothetical protein WDW38_002591 [Sanguina aurantia]
MDVGINCRRCQHGLRQHIAKSRQQTSHSCFVRSHHYSINGARTTRLDAIAFQSQPVTATAAHILPISTTASPSADPTWLDLQAWVVSEGGSLEHVCVHDFPIFTTPEPTTSHLAPHPAPNSHHGSSHPTSPPSLSAPAPSPTIRGLAAARHFAPGETVLSVSLATAILDTDLPQPFPGACWNIKMAVALLEEVAMDAAFTAHTQTHTLAHSTQSPSVSSSATLPSTPDPSASFHSQPSPASASSPTPTHPPPPMPSPPAGLSSHASCPPPSRIHPYLALLPARQPTPLTMSAREVAEVQYQPAVEAIGRYKALLEDAHRQLEAAQGSLSLSETSEAAAAAGVVTSPAVITLASLAWALSMVQSRTLRLAQLGVRAMIPGVDMLNHGGSDQCTGHLALGAAAWSSHPTGSSRTVFFIADRDIPQGEQVWWSYGSARGNDDLFMYHGFVLQPCEHDTVELFSSIRHLVTWWYQHQTLDNSPNLHPQTQQPDTASTLHSNPSSRQHGGSGSSNPVMSHLVAGSSASSGTSAAQLEAAVAEAEAVADLVVSHAEAGCSAACLPGTFGCLLTDLVGQPSISSNHLSAAATHAPGHLTAAAAAVPSSSSLSEGATWRSPKVASREVMRHLRLNKVVRSLATFQLHTDTWGGASGDQTKQRSKSGGSSSRDRHGDSGESKRNSSNGVSGSAQQGLVVRGDGTADIRMLAVLQLLQLKRVQAASTAGLVDHNAQNTPDSSTHSSTHSSGSSSSGGSSSTHSSAHSSSSSGSSSSGSSSSSTHSSTHSSSSGSGSSSSSSSSRSAAHSLHAQVSARMQQVLNAFPTDAAFDEELLLQVDSWKGTDEVMVHSSRPDPDATTHTATNGGTRGPF